MRGLLIAPLAATLVACLAAPDGSGDGGGGEDAAPADAAPGGLDATVCVPREQFPSFEDPFDTDALSWTEGIFVEPDGTPMVLAVTGGQAAVMLVDMAGHMLWLKTRAVDLRGVRVTVEMRELPNPEVSGARAWFAILPRDEPSSAITIMYLEDRLETPNGEIDHDPVMDLWWQMRIGASEIVLETAPDGVSWKTLDSVALPEGIDMANVEVGTKTDTELPGAGRLVIDNLNLPPNRCP
ncbi:MAG TPA: hypothetical protein VFU21_03845 [Kofleriaceae bacterium]|nr:hypothetical protein [Kofleriaceae bacterium]